MLDKQFEQKQSNGIWWIGIDLLPGVSAETIKSGEAQLRDVNTGSDAEPDAADAGEGSGADDAPAGW